jgi:cell division transport system ATP-binding protein
MKEHDNKKKCHIKFLEGNNNALPLPELYLNDPELILADEPTGNLDPQTSAEVLDVLSEHH